MTPVPSAPVPPADAGLVLLPLARGAINARLAPAGPAGPSSPAAPAGPTAEWLEAPGASFVTLTSGRAPGGALRGCIGSLVARRPLRELVRLKSISAE